MVVVLRQGFHPVGIANFAQLEPPPAELVSFRREPHIHYPLRSFKGLAMRHRVPVLAVGGVDEQAILGQGPVHPDDLRER